MAHSNQNLGSVTRYQVESHKLHQHGKKSVASAADTTRAIEEAITELANMDIEKAFVKLRAMVSMIKNKPGHNVVAFPGNKAQHSEKRVSATLAAE